MKIGEEADNRITKIKEQLDDYTTRLTQSEETNSKLKTENMKLSGEIELLGGSIKKYKTELASLNRVFVDVLY